MYEYVNEYEKNLPLLLTLLTQNSHRLSLIITIALTLLKVSTKQVIQPHH